jgi:NAD(P)-dependent dehydrogenase (short-subunit alcohol dehydrogenase family)
MADSKQSRSLTKSGRARRQFLERASLTAGTSAAAAMLPSLGSAQTPAAAPATPANCPEHKAPLADVKDKVAFVTGGNSGIGLGISRALANAGMKVCITYRSKEHLEEAMKYLHGAGSRIHAINVDVTDRAAMERAAEETVRVFGNVHLLVNNAGVGIQVPVGQATFDDWDWGIGVNLNGVFNGVKAFLPKIKAHNEGGHIVTTASMSGLFHGATAGVYTTTKFAVVGMMEALRAELVSSNIGVSVYCAGGVNTNIRNSDRNRPKELGDTGFKPDPKRLAQIQELAKKSGGTPPGMDPLEAGEGVLRGIRNNDLYIITHPEYAQGIRERSEAILASVPVDHPPVPEARMAYEQAVLRHPVYYNERDRKLCELARKTKKS